jgi:hypothetical protein
MHRPLDHLAAQLAGAACLALLAASAAHADIYRCVNFGGDVSYGDAPCPGEAMSSNITESVGACTTTECEAQVEGARASAEERLRAERAALNEMQDRRLRAEELDLQRRLQMQQGQLDALEGQLAAQRAADSGVYYPAYPLYPGADYFGGVRPGFGRHVKPGHRPCIGSFCAPRPDRTPRARAPFREPAVNVIAPGPSFRHR